jgi:hypothetical protein
MFLFKKSTPMATSASVPLGATSVEAVVDQISGMTDSDQLELYRWLQTLVKKEGLLSNGDDNQRIVSVRLTPERCQDLRSFAAQKSVTLSDVLRDAVDLYCQTHMWLK